jgi:hypothetical protein
MASYTSTIVLVQRDVERDGADFRRAAQDVVAIPGVAADDLEFLVGQAAGLVQDDGQVADERMFHPAAIKVMDEHPDAQLRRIDFLEHGRIRGVLISPHFGAIQE